MDEKEERHSVVNDDTIVIVDAVKAGLCCDNQIIEPSHVDVAAFADPYSVFYEKPLEIDEFDVVDEFVFELVVEPHLFVSENMTVDPQLGSGVLRRKVAGEVGQLLFDVRISIGQGIFFEKNVAVKLDMPTVIPIGIRGRREGELGIDLFPEPVLVKYGIKCGHQSIFMGGPCSRMI